MDMAQKFCSNCGAPLEAGTKFCSECGHPVEDVETAKSAGDKQLPAYENRETQIIPRPAANPTVSQPPSSSQSYGDKTTGEPLSPDDWLKWRPFMPVTRMNRLRYFINGLKLTGISIVLALIAFIPILGWIIAIAGGLCVAVANAVLNVYRLHDLDWTGWLFLVAFIPYVNIIFLLILLFAPGKHGPNKYGPDPLEGMR